MATSKQAKYRVHAAGADHEVTIDQAAGHGWTPLGDFDFAAGADQSVHLGDNTGEPSTDQAQLVFDAIRVTRLDTPPPPTNDPSDPSAAQGGGCATGHGAGGSLALVGLGLALSAARTRARRR